MPDQALCTGIGMRDAEYGRPMAIVIGASEVGSAIAVALHRAGCAVVLTDEVDPAWPRRGMQVPPADKAEFRRFLDRLGYDHVEETGNPAYRMFLGR